MLNSPELGELKAQIKNAVLRGSEDFFDEPKDLAAGTALWVKFGHACEVQHTSGSPTPKS